jgi:predicted glutamine amidotransferase
MCRLLAYASVNDRAVADLLGAEGTESLKELSLLHGDGWGIAWSAPATTTGDGAPDGALGVWRSTKRLAQDEEFDRLASTALGRSGLVHLRWASPGLPVREENTHPFLAQGWAFAHNGAIPHADRLDALLEPELAKSRRGDTDSERYFLHLLGRIAKTGGVVPGVRSAVGDIRERCGQGSLNAVLLSATTLVVVQGRFGTPSPREHLLAAVGSREALPPGHEEEYYDLRYRYEQGALVIGSTGLVGEGWTELPEDSVLVADYERQRVSVHDLVDGEVRFELPFPTASTAGREEDASLDAKL